MGAESAGFAARALGAGQNRVLEMIAGGAPLAQALRTIIDLIEDQAPDMLGSVLLVDEDGVHLRHGAAGRLPPAYWRAIDGQPVGPCAGSCGTAIHRRALVVAEDIEADPLWADYRELAAQHGLRACWSNPILDAQGRVLGSFALYFTEPQRPTERHVELITLATHIACIAIAWAKGEHSQLLRNLNERIKELTTLHRAGQLLQQGRNADAALLSELAALLPAGWQFPEVCEVRIAYDDLEARTARWRPSEWMQSATFKTGDGRSGVIEVAYLEPRPAAAEGPFLAEERSLINSLADLLASHLERARLMRELGEREATFRSVFEKAAIGMTLVDIEGEIVRCNPAFAHMLGRSEAEINGRPFRDFTHPEDIDANARLYRSLAEGKADHFRMHKRYLRADGSLVWAQLTVSKIPTQSGGVHFTVGMIEDITARRRVEASLRDSEQRFRSILENMTVGFVALDHDMCFTYVNPRAEKLLGRSAQSLLGRSYLEAFPEAKGSPFEAAYAEAAAKRVTVHNEDYFAPWQRWFEQRVDPTPEGVSVFFRDITARKASESRIEYLATHDELTDLPNRNLMHDRITQAIAHARRTGRQMAVMYLDLDRFKVVNDGFGHAFGDAVLKAAAQRLVQAIREDDTVARQSGDEFLVLLSDLRRSADAHIVAQKILDAFAQPLVVQEREVHAAFSIGMSLYPQDGNTADALIDNADVAMYRAKELGRSTYQLFTQEMSDETRRRVEIENALRSAAARGELHLAYQPKVDLATGRIIGCEALLRWTHPGLGMVSPGLFIPIAEESGLIVPIGDWVLRTACAQNKAWLDSGLPPLIVAVNVSARQFLQQDVVAWVTKTLDATGLPAELLELELTESLIAQDVEKTIVVVDRLKDLGVRLAIDDFGTGYSSLAYLKRFRFDALKIDQSFVRTLDSDVDDATIALAVIALAHNLRMTAVAEGVETEAQCRFLRLNRCDAMQGYFFSKPVPADEMERLLRSGRALPNPGKP